MAVNTAMLEGRQLAQPFWRHFAHYRALESPAASIGVEKLYCAYDGHPTAKGNEVIAGSIHEFLVSTGRCQ